APVAGVLVRLEGHDITAVTDSAGRFLLLRVPPGPQVIRTERIGYAVARVPLVGPTDGVVTRGIRLASSAPQLPGLIVTADPTGRARGELGTATVIEGEALRHYTAASLAGVLELVPGVVLSPPGLDQIQQIQLRSVPVSGLGGAALGSSSENLA